jgi:hypothetical protein
VPEANGQEGGPMKNVLWLVMCGVALVAAPFYAQTQKSGATSTDMEILRQKIKADKKLVIASNLTLTEAEAKTFWPIYDAYQADLTALNGRTMKLITTYASAYNAGPITSATAKSLLTEMMAIEDAELKLKQSYVPKFESALPAEKVARYVQIENKIRALIKYELATAIPLVQ